MGLILLIVLVILLLGTVPAYPYSASWGYGPSGLFGLLVVVLLLMLIFGALPLGFAPVAHPVIVAP
jgi:hypothetical protein